MSARTTRKRARTGSVDGHDSGAQDAEAGQNGEGMKRDEEFWLEDGTIILVARDVEFRVYSGILAHHSPVLKDLFAQPHLFRIVPMLGGKDMRCPVVHLSDSPSDLRHILRLYMPKGENTYVQ